MIKFLTLYLMLISSSFASGSAKLVDLMVNKAGTIELLSKYGLNKAEAVIVENYLSKSIAGLSSDKTLTNTELLELINKLPAAGKDALVRKELMTLLNKNVGNIKKADLVNAINNVMILSNRYGKSVILNCSECVNMDLTKHGFKFSVENIKNSSTNDLLKNVIPNNPQALNNYITQKMRQLDFGLYSKATPDLINSDEQKTLALFLAMAENGNVKVKNLIASIKVVSTKNGKTQLLDKSNRHKLWKLAAHEMTPAELEAWTKMIDELGVRANEDGLNVEQLFYKILKEKADSSVIMTKKYNNIKSKRCFFK